MGRWKESEKFPHTCAVSCNDEHIGFGQFGHDMNRFISAHNADCDAYEARIAELTDELARVKAESLRVVEDGQAKMYGECIIPQHVLYDKKVCMTVVKGYDIVSVHDDSRYEIPMDTIVQPVRLERWEDVG